MVSDEMLDILMSYWDDQNKDYLLGCWIYRLINRMLDISIN